jgi:hypothetical protein
MIDALSVVHDSEPPTSCPPVSRTRYGLMPSVATTKRDFGRSTIQPALSYFHPR